MPDEIDLAQQAEELFLESSRAQAALNVRRLAPRGSCHYCLATLKPAMVDGKLAHRQIFCDDECADAHAEEEKAKARRGGR